jgi:hypothetical protein
MIGIAFMALVLTLIMQTVLLQRAAEREQRLRAEANILQARAKALNQEARAILDQILRQTGKR